MKKRKKEKNCNLASNVLFWIYECEISGGRKFSIKYKTLSSLGSVSL